MLRGLLLALAILAILGSARADAQSLQGGSATSPAGARNWATAPLVVEVCPATAANEGGVRVVVRELTGTPILSVNGTQGSIVTLPSSSAPLAPASAPKRVIKFACEDASARVGADTFVDVTFPVRGAPLAPVVQ